MKFSKRIVTFIILSNVLFTGVVFYAFLKIGSEPMALIGAWFGFTTVELWSLAGIKKEEAKSEAIVERIIDIEGDTRGE